jgi:hypothetical protein
MQNSHFWWTSYLSSVKSVVTEEDELIYKPDKQNEESLERDIICRLDK